MVHVLIGYLIAGLLMILGLFVSLGETRHDITGGKSSIQREVEKKYKKLKLKERISFHKYCFPKSYQVQPQQFLVGDYMRPGSGHKSILVFHKIGAGKTCLSIQIAEKWKHKGRPLMVMPASLIPGFKNELRSPCAGNEYITEEERAKLKILRAESSEYKDIIKLSDTRIDRAYNILSYNKFSTSGRIEAPVIIIDEIQNVDNENGIFYKSILSWVEAHPAAPCIVMSGTPIFDHPKELVSIAKLLRIKVPDGDDPITPKNIPKLFDGKVSYFAGAPSYTFPEAIIKIVKCVMSPFQARWYKSEIESEMSKRGNLYTVQVDNDFYIKSRQRSNIVYPQGLSGVEGIGKLTKSTILSDLDRYSCKYTSMMKNIKKGRLSFIYSSFTGYGGIQAIKKILSAYGYKDFAKHGPGKLRYAVFSGEETIKEKDTIRHTFNSPANDNSSQLQIIIGSPSIKEGVSLMRVRSVHIMETYWNHSRLAQILGRAIRYCSHKSLPAEKRNVKVYLYAAIVNKNAPATPINSIDLYMLDLADKKKAEVEPYIDALMKCAFDRYIYYPE